jgi:hypothetical protein
MFDASGAFSIGQIGRCRSDRDIYYWNRHALAKLLKATKVIQSAEIPQFAEAKKPIAR